MNLIPPQYRNWTPPKSFQSPHHYSSADAAEAIRLWPLAANMVAFSLIGLALGRLQLLLTPTPTPLHAPVLVMSALGNVGNLPLVLIPTIAANPNVGLEGQVDLGLQYVLLTYFWACFIQFPLGYILLQSSPGSGVKGELKEQQILGKHQKQQKQQQRQAGVSTGSAAAALGQGGEAISSSSSSSSSMGVIATATAAAAAASGSGARVAPQQQQAEKVLTQQQQQEGHQQQQSRQTEDLLKSAGQQQQQHQQGKEGLASPSGPDWSFIARNVFTPPTLACLAAVPVGTWPELQTALFTQTGA